jgi:hypothetical protein
MNAVVFAITVALASGQSGNQPFAGTWTAELSGKTYVRLELVDTNGVLSGRIGLGDIQVNSEGEVRTAGEVPRDLTPIFDLVLSRSVLSSARKDGDDTDRFELRLVGDQAELSFLFTETDRQELARNGVPPKPIRLKKVAK